MSKFYSSENLLKIFHHFGIYAQLDKAEEECMELLIALRRLKNDPENHDYFLNVIEEMGDVNLISAQFNAEFDGSVRKVVREKIERTLNRIEHGK